jgi:hypothetical protein
LKLHCSVSAQPPDFARWNWPKRAGLYPGLIWSGIITASLRGEIAMNVKKAIAEFIGTFALVLIGCGAAVIGGMGSGATSIDLHGIAAAVGLPIVAQAYGIGHI